MIPDGSAAGSPPRDTLIGTRVARQSPIPRTGSAPLSEWTPELADLQGDCLSAHFRQSVPEKPAVLVSLGPAQVPTGTRRRKIRHTGQFHIQDLVYMPRDDISHLISHRDTVKRKLR